MARINKNLLLLAKIENRQFADIQGFSLNEVINHTLDELEDFIVDKNMIIQTRFIENSQLKSNLSLTEILVNNLLLNAVRYSENGGFITIKSTKKELIISNKGTQKLNDKGLFDRFWKMSQDSKGNGLGLAIVKEICHNNGWQVNYKFEDNQHQFIVKF